ncbi:unnamed protein product, partial [marine sediment metagenome]
MGWTRGKERVPEDTKESVTLQGHRGRVVEKMIRCGRPVALVVLTVPINTWKSEKGKRSRRSTWGKRSLM